MTYLIAFSLLTLYTGCIHPADQTDFSRFRNIINAESLGNRSIEEFIFGPEQSSPPETESDEGTEGLLYKTEQPNLQSFFTQRDPDGLDDNDFVLIQGDTQGELPIPRSMLPPMLPPTSPKQRSASFPLMYAVEITRDNTSTLSILNAPHHIGIWNELCKAINNNVVNESCTPEHIKTVANTVFLIHGKLTHEIESYATLLEYVIQQPPSNERLTVLERLCAAGITFLKTGYEICLYRHNANTFSYEPIKTIHRDPPIGTAIRYDNVDAFQKLLPKSLEVTLEKIYSLQGFIDKVQTERYAQNQNPINIDKMKALLADIPASSCAIQ